MSWNVHRGCAAPSEYGKYFFSDFADARIRSLEYEAGILGGGKEFCNAIDLTAGYW